MKKKVVMQKNAGEKRGCMNGKSKSLPVFVNRAQLASETKFPLRKLYRAEIQPDAVDIKGAPLFFAHRVSEIAQLLNVPKIV